MSERVIIFKRFERFWHWSQAALIIVLLISGFDIHGSYTPAWFRDSSLGAYYNCVVAGYPVSIYYLLAFHHRWSVNSTSLH